MNFDALGPLRVESQGEEIDLPPAARRLLSALLLEAGGPVSADRLIDRIWAGSPPETARNTLQAHVSTLRRRLPDRIDTRHGSYRLDLEGCEIATVDFERLADESERLFSAGDLAGAIERVRGALDLWRGDPYPELIEADAARAEADRLRGRRRELLLRLGRLLIASGTPDEAIAPLRSIIAEGPLDEPTWEQLILAYYLTGRQADALRAYSEVATVLGEELGIAPGERLQQLEERILLQDPALGPATTYDSPTNLPPAEDSFIGRNSELARIEELLEGTRAVTIVGGPGMGKTRLAIEAGRAALNRFPGGVWLVRLAGATQEADVSATIASATGMTDELEGLEDLAAILSRRPALLILDNCEHLLESARRFIAATAPGPLKVLVTSRAPVGMPGERVIRLGPLPLEDPADDVSEAMRLFMDRALALDPPNRDWPSPQLKEICRRAAGIPLALELMASWVPALSLENVGDMTLAPAAHTIARPTPHHGSLAEAIDWTLDRLAPSTAGAFAAASVFAGSFEIEGFTEVCLAPADRAEPRRLLADLVGTSLISVEQGEAGHLRYRMLEPLRGYAVTRLQPSERLRVGERHATWFASRASTVAALARGPEEARSFKEVDAEIADFRQAMRFLLEAGRHDQVAGIATALQRYWFARYLGWEAQRWLGESLAGDLSKETRLDTLLSAGWAAYSTASYDSAEQHYEEALTLARRHEDLRAEGRALYGLARIHLPRRFRDGESLLLTALELFEKTESRVEAAECRLWLGLRAATAGDGPTARHWLDDAVAELEHLGHRGLVSVGHRYLSLAAWHEGHEERARRHLERAEAEARATDDRRAIGGALIQRGLVEGRWGDPAVAAVAIIEALQPIPAGNEIDYCLVLFGALPLLLRTGRHQTVVRLLAHLDRVYYDYGWLPLDERIPVVTEFRKEAAATTEGVDCSPLPSVEIAREISEVLLDVARDYRH